MTAENAMEPSGSRKVQLILATIVTLIGIALLVYMIKVEDEPGALPLFLTIAGLAWLGVTLARSRTHRR